MDNKIKNALPQNLQDLVDEIENYSNVDINILPNPFPVMQDEIETNIYPALAGITKDSMTIYYRNGNLFSFRSIAHELFHLKRYSIEKVPTLYPILETQSNIDITNEIDNALDHVHIIPLVDNIFASDENSYWNSMVEYHLNKSDKWNDDFKKRKGCIITKLYTTFIIKDEEIINHANQCISKLHLKSLMDKFEDRIRRDISNKQKSLSTICRYLVDPPFEFNKEVILKTFDIKNRKEINQPLPYE